VNSKLSNKDENANDMVNIKNRKKDLGTLMLHEKK